MPKKPKAPCRYPGCTNLCDSGVYCSEHAKENDPRHLYDKARGTRTQRGYDSKWYKFRKMYLARNPLCVKCLEEGNIVPATVIDHIVPHRGDMTIFWDLNNLQPLCKHHHDQKTASGL